MKFDLQNIIKKVEDMDQLTVPFTKEEIDKVIKEMMANRAPRPDGFSGIFLTKCWHVIEDFYKLCDQFLEGNLTCRIVGSTTP